MRGVDWGTCAAVIFSQLQEVFINLYKKQIELKRDSQKQATRHDTTRFPNHFFTPCVEQHLFAFCFIAEAGSINATHTSKDVLLMNQCTLFQQMQGRVSSQNQRNAAAIPALAIPSQRLGQQPPVTTPQTQPLSNFVVRKLETNPPTPSVSSQFGGKLPHVC